MHIPLSLAHTFLFPPLNQCRLFLKDQEYTAAPEMWFQLYGSCGAHSLPSTCSNDGGYEVQIQNEGQTNGLGLLDQEYHNLQGDRTDDSKYR